MTPPPIPPTRFQIKIFRANDLSVVNGSPRVVVEAFDFFKRRTALLETRIVPNTNNPVFNEILTVANMSATGQIKVTVFNDTIFLQKHKSQDIGHFWVDCQTIVAADKVARTWHLQNTLTGTVECKFSWETQHLTGNSKRIIEAEHTFRSRSRSKYDKVPSRTTSAYLDNPTVT